MLKNKKKIEKLLFVLASKTNVLASNVLKYLAELMGRTIKKISEKDKTPLHITKTLFKKDLFCKKKKYSLLCLASNHKKRPNNLFLGRFSGTQLLDAVDLEINNFRKNSSQNCKISSTMNKMPCFVFSGSDFNTKTENQTVYYLLLDIFRGTPAHLVDIRTLDLVTSIVAFEGKVYSQKYRISLKHSMVKISNIELEACGPLLELTIRHCTLACNESSRQPLRFYIDKKNHDNSIPDQSIYKTTHLYLSRQKVIKTLLSKMRGFKG